jgi:shikimate dehydrogenase
VTARACVIGDPVAHSRSPLIHNHWLKLHGIDGAYDRTRVSAEDLPDFVAALGGPYVGCNVTVPHKEHALELADEADEAARAIGAANTLWRENGQIRATNTDAHGFLAHLEASAPGWRRDAPATVIGAGGAARAIVFALLGAGASHVRIANRSLARAKALATRFGENVRPVPWERRGRALEDAGLVVNATTLGMKGAPALELSLDRLPRDAVVYDIVYAPLLTDLLARAEARGNPTVDGLGMLLHQAAPAFARFFGVMPHVTPELRRAALAEMEPASC